MIKKLQALRAKKGFTLVELIVVIAIIGVLAAILVPTMLGYVTQSQVTSKNSTAASIEKAVDQFLTNADTNGYGMLLSKTAIEELDITVGKDKEGKKVVWTCTAAKKVGKDGYFKTGSSITWGGEGCKGVSAGDPKTDVTSAETLLCITLADLFPSLKSASIHVVLKGGDCTAVAYTEDTNKIMDADTNKDYPKVTTDGEFPAAFEWDEKTAGVSSSGFIVGTSPVVPLGKSTVASSSAA